MIRASFVMTVFCDMPDHNCRVRTRWRYAKFTYHGDTRDECEMKALKDGWTLSLLSSVCPDCAKKTKDIQA